MWQSFMSVIPEEDLKCVLETLGLVRSRVGPEDRFDRVRWSPFYRGQLHD